MFRFAQHDTVIIRHVVNNGDFVPQSPSLAPHQKNVLWLNCRIELDIILPTAPGASRATQSTLYSLLIAFLLPELCDVNIVKGSRFAERIAVHYYANEIIA